jgi:enamine deaminase RidA (YjgF/YER057c/UK114 family)
MRAAICGVLLLAAVTAQGADVVRYPLPNGSKFPIANAVEVPAGTTLIFQSGSTATPKDPTAAEGSVAYWGDTKTQTISALTAIKTSLESEGVDFGNVVKMVAFLVGDPAQGGKMDFKGFMEGYSQFFGTAQQPNLPARSTVQVASLVTPGAMVEIELVLAKPMMKKK